MKKIVLICALFLLSAHSARSDEINLEGIKVNLIGRKTRVTFLFDKEVAYTTNRLEDPFRIMMDFVEKVSCRFEKVKVFNMGFVKNVRSFFVDNSSDLYILDACVIELDRKCAVDMFWSGTALHIDFVDVEVIEREKKEELMSQAKRKKAEDLYKEGLLFMKEEKYEEARKKFLASMQADDSFRMPADDIRKCEKLSDKKSKEIKKTAFAFEKEMEARLKEDRKAAAMLENEITQKKHEAISKHIDAKDYEQKGLIAYKMGEYKRAIGYWEEVMNIYPENRKIAGFIADARKSSKEDVMKESEVFERRYEEEAVSKEQESQSVIGLPRVEDFNDELRLIFPIKTALEYRFAGLKNPYRIMVYFKKKTKTMMDPKIDVNGEIVKCIRAYVTKAVDDGEGWHYIEALMIDLYYAAEFQIQQDKENFQVILFKNNTVPQENSEHPAD